MERDFMKRVRAKIEFAQLPNHYAGLCQLLTPRPIHDKLEFLNVTELTDTMAGHKLTPDQEDYFDLLCRLIEDYEQERIVPSKTTGLEALKSILDAHNISAAGLARVLRVHRTLGAMILRGERKLTLDHVRTLARHFGVSADLFVW
jgi:HTH-type transcriptional regulator/antitoxin HigA